jgi:uncharacterized coiled-coil DUF342 family protein
MLTPDERKAVQAQLDELQPRIKDLKQRLNELYGQKEKAFEQRGPVGKEISELVSQLKTLKKERDDLTDDVKKLKEARTALNKDILRKIEEAKKLNAEKKKASEKSVSKDSPGFLKRAIERLELRIETDVMSFDKEKALMKEIKDLKKRMDAAKQANAMWGESRHISQEIDALKAKADDAHKQLQEKAQLSQNKHEQLMGVSKKLDELRGAGKTFAKDIGRKKSEMGKLGEELDALNARQKELRTKLDAERKEQDAEKEQKRKQTFSEKLAAVKAKMKSGGKLTTEDILVLQGEN